MPAVLAPAPVTWLIFVDDLHLEFRNTGHTRNAIKKMVAELIHDGDSFSIVSSGPSGMAIDVTMDRRLLDAEIKRATGSGLRYDDVVQGPNGASEARYRASQALATAQSMLTNLSRMAAGRKSLLYITNGYSFDILPDRVAGSMPLGRGRDVTRTDVRKQLAELTATATRSAVRLFTIDPRIAFNDLDSDTTPPAHRSAMHSVMRSIAEDSGGFAIVEGDFVLQLRRIADAMRR